MSHRPLSETPRLTPVIITELAEERPRPAISKHKTLIHSRSNNYSTTGPPLYNGNQLRQGGGCWIEHIILDLIYRPNLSP